MGCAVDGVSKDADGPAADGHAAYVHGQVSAGATHVRSFPRGRRGTQAGEEETTRDNDAEMCVWLPVVRRSWVIAFRLVGGVDIQHNGH
jgi:hypothetical protein